jgi:hypothetical protein
VKKSDREYPLSRKEKKQPDALMCQQGGNYTPFRHIFNRRIGKVFPAAAGLSGPEKEVPASGKVEKPKR